MADRWTLRRERALICVRTIALLLVLYAVYRSFLAVLEVGGVRGRVPTISVILVLAQPVIFGAFGLLLAFFGRAVARWLTPVSTPQCLRCGYDLSVAETGRCPECGYIAPADARS
ncbi:MAG: hypothetical protein KDA25_12280 [Phycisphaerales bacterium]|nr:hypothetical protein [Phycisphaerales bacterium]